MNDKTQLSSPKRNLLRRVLILAGAAVVTGLGIGEVVLVDKIRPGQASLYMLLVLWTALLLGSVTLFLACIIAPVRFYQWLFSGRVVRRTLIVLGWTTAIVALLYGEENWRGRRAWNQYRRELESTGAPSDYSALIPKPVPDELNFAATPFIQSWFAKLPADKIWGDNYEPASKRVLAPTASNGKRQFVNLVAWEMAFESVQSGQPKSDQEFKSDKLDAASRANAAAGVLKGLKASEAKLSELRSASRKPDSRYPVHYDLDNPWGILLPHLSNIKAACLRLQLEACAELAAGRSNQALEDVKLAFDVADSVKDEPFLISPLVRFACMHITIQAVWEGLAEHRWSDAQLQELQTRLQQYDFIAALKRPLDGERAAGILTADLLAAGKYRLNDLAGDASSVGSKSANMFGRIAPRGWYELEKLSYCRLFQLQMDGTFDANAKRIYPQKVKSNSEALDRAFAGRNPVTTICTRHQLLAVVLLPALGKVPGKAARAQVVVDQAVLACALERFRLANGSFPETLDALVPKFVSHLPKDVLTGESYKYHRTDDGKFALYSVGWNEKDDGGIVASTQSGSPDMQEGDWVWQYRAN